MIHNRKQPGKLCFIPHTGKNKSCQGAGMCAARHSLGVLDFKPDINFTAELISRRASPWLRMTPGMVRERKRAERMLVMDIEESRKKKAVVLFLDKLVDLSGRSSLRRVSLGLANLRFRVLESSDTFAWLSTESAYCLYSQGYEARFSDWSRGSHIYRRGLNFRIRQLEDAYCLASIDYVRQDALVVDCGANYGDFSRAILRKMPDAKLKLVEPVPWDAKNLRTSFGPDSVFECAASDSSGEATFYLSESSGDSSLFQPRSKHVETKVAKKTLDQILKSQEVFLLKVEAEGGEPEILRGATQVLARTQYVVVDGGPERGVECEPTIEECSKILLSHGFREVARSKTRKHVVLFRKP